MAISVRHDDEFVEIARIYAKANKRSIFKQIEHWVVIGKMVEDNPDLPYYFVKEAIIATAEANAGKATKYVREKRD